jgi:hypothetical protein
MSALAFLIVAIALAGGTCAILAAMHHRRKPPELRGDWWTPFEREFRAFAREQAAVRDRQRRRHRGERA